MNVLDIWRWWRRGSRKSASGAAAVPAVAPVKMATWTAFDRDNWKHFLSTETGRNLVQRLQATEYVLAIANAANQIHSSHAAGNTCGYNHCLRQILSLSYSCDAQREDKPDSGASGESQAAEREATETLHRLSPK